MIETALAANPTLSPAPTLEQFQAAYHGNRIAEALALIERITEARPRDAQALYLRAFVLYVHYLDADQARALLDQALELRPDYAEALQLLSNIHLGAGDKASAAAVARRCIAVAPNASVAYLNLVMAEPDSGPALVAPIERALATPGLSAYHQRSFHSALGKIFDRADQPARAFAHFTAANRLAGGAYPAGGAVARLKEQKEVFDRAFFAERHGFGVEDDRMIFITGAPRSGSTLLERMLASHPEIDTAGERSEISVLNVDLHKRAMQGGRGAGFCFSHLRDLSAEQSRETARRYLDMVRPAVAAPDSRWWIDKLPGNYAYVGWIHLLFPNATILQTRRHVLDVALSCYCQSFSNGHEFSNDLGAFAHFWVVYAETMIHWREALPERVLPVRYEALAQGPEPQARRVLDHVGADWTADCLTPQTNERVVTTASVTQVREPIHARAIGRWRRYEAQLQPLIKALGGMKVVEKLAELDAEGA